MSFGRVRKFLPLSSSSVVAAAVAEKQMEDVKTGGPMELVYTAASADEAASLPTAPDCGGGGGVGGLACLEGGSLSETNPLANAGPPSPLTGCYLLIIIGEPHSGEALRVIVEQLKQGELVAQQTWWLRNSGESSVVENFDSAILRCIPENKVTSTPTDCRFRCNRSVVVVVVAAARFQQSQAILGCASQVSLDLNRRGCRVH